MTKNFLVAGLGLIFIGAGCLNSQKIPAKPYDSDTSVPAEQVNIPDVSPLNDEAEDTGDPVANGTAVGPAVQRK